MPMYHQSDLGSVPLPLECIVRRRDKVAAMHPCVRPARHRVRSQGRLRGSHVRSAGRVGARYDGVRGRGWLCHFHEPRSDR